MDDLEDLQASEFVTDTDDQDSLDERIDTEQRLHNKQLWASFQNAACCITKLYKDRTQPNLSPWIPFQNAASNLTTLYKDCIESQRRFAKIGYQVGKRKRMRDLRKWLKKQQIQLRQQPQSSNSEHNASRIESGGEGQASGQQQQNAVTSILAVNQLNLDCDESPTHSMQALPISNLQQASQQHLNIEQQQIQPHNYGQNHYQSSQTQQANLQSHLSNNDDDLVTFQQALVQPSAAIRGIKSNQNRRQCLNTAGYLNSRSIDPSKSEEDRLSELNQFLSEEYHRHVGSRKRSCAAIGGNQIKRVRD